VHVLARVSRIGLRYANTVKLIATILSIDVTSGVAREYTYILTILNLN